MEKQFRHLLFNYYNGNKDYVYDNVMKFSKKKLVKFIIFARSFSAEHENNLFDRIMITLNR